MSTPPETPTPQDSGQGGVNSNLAPEGEKPSGEQHPDPATHADSPEVRDKAAPAPAPAPAPTPSPAP